MPDVANYRTALPRGVEALDAEGNALLLVTPDKTPEAWAAYTAWRKTPGANRVPLPPVVPPVPTEADASYILSARRNIDAAAGRARARFITIGPGQEATYTAKYAEAQAYVGAGYPADASAYPWVAAEAASTGLTAAQTADRIKGLGDAWRGLVGPAIEAARIAGKDSLDGLTTRAQVDAAEAAAIAALDAIQPT